MTGPGEHVYRAASLAALVACIVATGIAVVQKAVPTWDGSLLLLLCAAVAIEAYAAFRLSHGTTLKSTLAHAAIFLIAGQLCLDVVDRHAPVESGSLYVDARAFTYFGPALLTWLAITGVMRQLAVLDQPPTDGFLDRSPVRTLTVRFFLAGTLLFAAAALTQPDIARFFKLSQADSAGPLLNVFAYFGIGILLLSRLEYDAMRHLWQAQRTVISAGMAAHWTRYAVLFAAAVAVLAFVLPTNQTLGILGPGHDDWNELLLLLRGPLGDLLSLLHPTRPVTINPHLKPPPGFHPPPRRPPAPHHGGGSGGSWYAAIQTILFWTGIVGVAAYLVRAYIRRGRRSFPRPRVPGISGLGHLLARLCTTLFRRLRSLLEAAADRLPDALSARLVAPSLRSRRAGAGSPVSGPTRQQILAYYRRMVRQAERCGVRRIPAQSPEEYAALLTLQVPDAAGDVALLTEAFVEARYSRHEIPSARVGPVRTGWERIRQALSARS